MSLGLLRGLIRDKENLKRTKMAKPSVNKPSAESSDEAETMEVEVQIENRNICHICGKSFENEELNAEHLKKKHPTPRTAQSCDICGRKYNSKENLESHKKYDHNISPRRTKTLPEQRRHPESGESSSKELPFPFLCTVCFKTFPSRNELHNHYSNVHDIMVVGEKCSAEEEYQKKYPYLCVVCNACFLHEIELLRHRQNCCRCPLCHKIFNSSILLYYHILKFHKKEEFPAGTTSCPFCEDQERFNNLDHFIEHCRDYHPQVYPYFCDDCGAYFQTLEEYQGHELEHQFEVEVEKILESEGEEEKEEEHGIETLWDIEEERDPNLSSASTLEADSLDLAELSMSCTSTPQQKQKKFLCGYCPKMFLTLKERRYHYCPDDPKQFKCVHCPKNFLTEKELTKHYIDDHKRCLQCEKEYPSRENLLYHMLFDHHCERGIILD